MEIEQSIDQPSQVFWSASEVSGMRYHPCLVIFFRMLLFANGIFAVPTFGDVEMI